MIEIVIAAPPMLMVAPNGKEIEYDSFVNPIRFASIILIGIFAAELRVKNAGIALSFKQNQTRGYGFCLISTNATKG